MQGAIQVLGFFYLGLPLLACTYLCTGNVAVKCQKEVIPDRKKLNCQELYSLYGTVRCRADRVSIVTAFCKFNLGKLLNTAEVGITRAVAYTYRVRHR